MKKRGLEHLLQRIRSEYGGWAQENVPDPFFPVVLVVVGALALGGCAKDKSRPTHYAGDVRGTVTLDDQPLPFGTISFIPQTPESEGGRPGIAEIQPDGSYWVGNANPEKPAGLQPGKYRIVVLAMVPDPNGTGRPIAKLAIDERYADAVTTPFEVQISAGKNVCDFVLTSKGNGE